LYQKKLKSFERYKAKHKKTFEAKLDERLEKIRTRLEKYEREQGQLPSG
jgi:hypothetical protein